jgi:hypothetical protein
MLIGYSIKLEKDGLTITQRIDAGTQDLPTPLLTRWKEGACQMSFPPAWNLRLQLPDRKRIQELRRLKAQEAE